MNQRWGPSVMVVGGLIVLAIIVSIIIWATSFGRSAEPTAPTTVLPQDPVGLPVDVETEASAESAQTNAEALDGEEAETDAEALDRDEVDVSAEEPDLPAATQIVSVASFDPVEGGGNGEENNDLLGRATDGDVTTAWRTQCYSNQFMGAKPGVGLVASFDGALNSDLRVQIDNGPYNVNFYAWDGEVAPTTLDGWGEPFDRAFGPSGDTITASAAGFNATHVLIQLLELGENSACTEDNPYSGAVSEISIS